MALISAFALPLAAQASQPQTKSLLGRTLHAPPLDDRTRERLQSNLEKARLRLEQSPDDPDSHVWMGRRTAYLGLYREAVEIYTKALERFPESPHLLRHRGHRYISLRRFDEAIRDFERAARLTQGRPDEVEPDGAPNAQNIPLSTLQTNIWYHLGLARYLKGDFVAASEAYQRCLDLSPNDDMRVASRYWLYMSLRRQGKEKRAENVLKPVGEGLSIIENHAYYDLLLLFKGLKDFETLSGGSQDDLGSATVGYGLGNWRLMNGQIDQARGIFQGLMRLKGWGAFGYIAAEAELARMGPSR